jgi:hypothetical protein
MRKVSFSVSEIGRVTYAANLKGHAIVARASDYVLIDTEKVIGTQVVDEEWALKQVRVDAAYSVEALAGALTGLLALVRYRREVAGITLPDDTSVRTDRNTQAQLTSAIVQVNAGVISEVRWKMEGGFSLLTGVQITAIAGAVTVHVAACFAAEEAVSAQIADVETLDALQSMDIQVAFDAALGE